MSERTKVLIIDDEVKMRDLLRRILEREQFEVLEASDVGSMFSTLDRTEVDLVSLDLGLPGEDGFSAIQKLRTRSDVPIVIITGKDETLDKVIGLELGADDYIEKPFDIRELVARIRAVLRRRKTARTRAAREAQANNMMVFDGWRMDLIRRELHRASGEEQDLTGSEFELLKIFVTNPHRVLSRDQLADRLRGRQWSPDDRGIDMQVRRLRKKIEDDPSRPRRIKTIRGAGYLFATTVEARGPSDCGM